MNLTFNPVQSKAIKADLEKIINHKNARIDRVTSKFNPSDYTYIFSIYGMNFNRMYPEAVIEFARIRTTVIQFSKIRTNDEIGKLVTYVEYNLKNGSFDGKYENIIEDIDLFKSINARWAEHESKKKHIYYPDPSIDFNRIKRLLTACQNELDQPTL